LLLVACDKGEKNENQAPETLIVPKAINLSGDQRLKSTVRLAWFGADFDGFVSGYEFTQDQITWHYTTKTDSTFIFIIKEGQDTNDISFWVRSIDNMGLKDLTPAKLTVPIKNTPPNITLNKTLSTSDTALLVATLFWDANDPDGIENLKGFQIKLNDGEWFDIPKKANNVSLTPADPSATGATNAKVYLSASEEIGSLVGLKMNDTNSIYIRSFDLSQTYSELDTLSGLFFKGKNSDLLVIGGDRDRNSFYKQRISNVYPVYDYLDFTANDGADQPTFWNPTFTLMALQYEKLFIYSDKTTYLNDNTKKVSLILEAAAESIEEYIAEGGKAFIIGYFNNPLDSQSNVLPVLNIERIDKNSKGLFLDQLPDALKSQEAGYPDLGTNKFPETASPFEKTTDVISIYEGQFDQSSPYSGPKTLGIKKVNESTGKTFQVYVAASMADMNYDYSKVDSLFHHVLNVEFNW
jgi:hypothetical protein